MPIDASWLLTVSMRNQRVPAAASAADRRAAGAAFGNVPTKKQAVFGYKLHLLVTLGKVIRDFALARDNTGDLAAIGDKAYISAPLAGELLAERGMALLMVPRRNQRRQLSTATGHLLNSARQIVETVNDQLTAQFGLAAQQAHTFRSLCARLYTKLTAHMLCLYLNRLLGVANWLRFKALTFPN